LRVDAAMLADASGDPLAGGQDFVATFSSRGVTMALVQVASSHPSLAAPAVDVLLDRGSLAPARRIHDHAGRKARSNKTGYAEDEYDGTRNHPNSSFARRKA
jgi:hypothetical protein